MMLQACRPVHLECCCLELAPASDALSSACCAADHPCACAFCCRDTLDRQCFEERMLEVGREIVRNDFPDVILLQARRFTAASMCRRHLAAFCDRPVGTTGACCPA